MSFKIVITDNDNGNVLVNQNNVTAIIGAFTTSDDYTGEMAFCKSSSKDILCAIVGAKKRLRLLKAKTLLLK